MAATVGNQGFSCGDLSSLPISFWERTQWQDPISRCFLENMSWERNSFTKLSPVGLRQAAGSLVSSPMSFKGTVITVIPGWSIGRETHRVAFSIRELFFQCIFPTYGKINENHGNCGIHSENQAACDILWQVAMMPGTVHRALKPIVKCGAYRFQMASAMSVLRFSPSRSIAGQRV